MNDLTTRKRTIADTNRMMRDIIAEEVNEERARRLIQSLIELGIGGVTPAITYLLDRILGKAGVGSASVVVDDAMADAATEHVSHLTPDEMLQLLRLQCKANGEVPPPELPPLEITHVAKVEVPRT